MKALPGQDLPLETLVKETAAAFRVWERVADISFHRVVGHSPTYGDRARGPSTGQRQRPGSSRFSTLSGSEVITQTHGIGPDAVILERVRGIVGVTEQELILGAGQEIGLGLHVVL